MERINAAGDGAALAAPPRATRRGGAPKGNRNAAKLGRYRGGKDRWRDDSPLGLGLDRFERIARLHAFKKKRLRHREPRDTWDQAKLIAELRRATETFRRSRTSIGTPAQSKDFCTGRDHCIGRLMESLRQHPDRNDFLDDVCRLFYAAGNGRDDAPADMERLIAYATGWQWFCAALYGYQTGHVFWPRPIDKEAEISSPADASVGSRI